MQNTDRLGHLQVFSAAVSRVEATQAPCQLPDGVRARQSDLHKSTSSFQHGEWAVQGWSGSKYVYMLAFCEQH